MWFSVKSANLSAPMESNSNSMTGSPVGIAVGVGALDVFARQTVGQFFLDQIGHQR
jgi:hypothetical protein